MNDYDKAIADINKALEINDEYYIYSSGLEIYNQFGKEEELFHLLKLAVTKVEDLKHSIKEAPIL
ncbi:hypothetical protein [Vallitalea maricola]|uniref:Uncharacterized protein n=1 Tax=Vallitalea maricola TaxID=3074433 RepID=A0ACB5UMN8_9FIRM|nr:hypothetical protein AN2V17_30600 [Vallitalea sp. AN17-2]